METDREAVLYFAVTDTGIGISPETRQRLFQPFTQADGSTTRKYGGTGLGLAISKRLVEAMNGSIGVNSTSGKGLTFWFTAPFETQSQPVSPLELRRFSLDGLHVLIVDDNETNRLILHRQVTSWRMRNAAAADGLEALALLRRQAIADDPFDIVILDMHMPGMDGLQLARAIQADDQINKARLVMLTSMGSRDAETMRSCGIEAHLTKPVKASHLFNCLATLIAGRPNVPMNLDGAPLTPSLSSSDGERVPGGRVRGALTPASPPSSAAGATGKRGRILLAEDNAVNQQLATVMVRKLGYDVDLATTGVEVIKALERNPYDLILMDCQMPEMDGYAATSEIRSGAGASRLVPIVAMTAHALAGDREKCLAAGMNDHLAKPLRVEELHAALARWLPPTTHDLGRADLLVSLDARQRVPTTPSPLDADSLKRIRELAQGTDPSLVARVLNTFVTDSARRMTALREAAGQQDVESLARESHALKGASLNVGATRIAQIGQQVYERSLANQMTGLDELLEQLDRELIQAKDQIEIELKAGDDCALANQSSMNNLPSQP